ncbi:MAG: potassium transporter TrkG [Candidatus Krumholzibacteriia bacterium]
MRAVLPGISLARRAVLAAAGACGLAGLVIEHGTYPGAAALAAARGLTAAAVALFAAELVLAWREAPTFRRFLRNRWPHVALLVLLVLEGLAILVGRRSLGPDSGLGRLLAEDLTRVYLVLLQVYILGVFVVEAPHVHRRLAGARLRPAASFVLLFALLILVGTALLLLPRATPPGAPIGPLDALFTSTSAVCVTGLVVRDTGTGFTVFGQAVILLLIQLGGLGIMSLTATLSLLLGRGIGVRESSLLREVFQLSMVAEVGRTVRGLVLVTLAVEAAGAALLYAGLAGVVADPGQRAWTAVFHAVSAFCNAGFSTFGDSLAGVADRPLVVQTVAVLLILGGAGYGVLVQTWAWLRGRALRQPPGPGNRLGLQARVVLGVSSLLLVAGTAVILTVESGGALAGQPWWLRLSQAFFQAATCRTAGFNTLDLTALAPATLLVMMVLMFIGGAPGSTAGGMKVTTVAIAWANMRAIARGQGRVRLIHRELDPVLVQRAMLVLSAGIVVTAAGVFVLLLSEGAPLFETAFETVSALGTVGLSLGLTPHLTEVGRLVVIVLMFIGRLGPLTLASSLTGPGREPRVRLPRGRLQVG